MIVRVKLNEFFFWAQEMISIETELKPRNGGGTCWDNEKGHVGRRLWESIDMDTGVGIAFGEGWFGIKLAQVKNAV